MLTRRKLVLGAALAVLVPAAPALAAPDPLLADILYGVSDALIRDYIYRNYEYGRWDGRYWWYRGNRYTPATGSQASASAALRRTGRSSASASAAPALCGRKASRRTGPEASAASTRSGPAPAAFRRSRPQAAACRRSASASLRRSGRQRPGRSRRSPLTPLRLNRSRTSHRDAGPSPIHGLPTVSIQVPVFGLTNVRWRTIILAMEG